MTTLPLVQPKQRTEGGSPVSSLPAAAARRAKAKENKIKFENMKQQRNQYKAGLRAAKEEIERMRQEVGMVEELKKQVESLRENIYL